LRRMEDVVSKSSLTRSTDHNVSIGLVRFLEKYAFDGGDNLKGSLESCLKKCEDEGLHDLDDLRQLSRRVWLGEYFPAKIALRMENAFDSPTFDREMKSFAPNESARVEAKTKQWTKYLSLKTTIEIMQATCTTLGIVSALMLTMNVSSFSSMTIDEWDMYETGVGADRCDPSVSWNSLKKNETQSECAHRLRIWSEWFFVLLNQGAVALLLVSVLFSSWLYIGLAMPNAVPSRPDEERIVVTRFSGEFVMLQVSFAIAMMFSVFGITQLMQLKISTWDLVTAVNWINITAVVLIFFIGAWLWRAVLKSRHFISLLRSENSNDRAASGLEWERVGNVDDISTEPAGEILEGEKYALLVSALGTSSASESTGGAREVIFTEAQWKDFGLNENELRMNHVLKAGNHYYKPKKPLAVRTRARGFRRGAPSNADVALGC